jgi:Tfp pilus assembly protein PilN
MPQQINLYTPVLLSQQRYFSAHVMVQSLAVLMVVGAALCHYEVTRLQHQSDALRQTLQTQTTALEGLRATTRQRQAAAAPAEVALAQELTVRRAELKRLEGTLADLQLGVFRPGEGHAARLALVARSIPPSVWVTLVRADAGRFELSGFTFDPAALNLWIGQLAASPLLTGQRLAAVDVTKVSESADMSRPVWSFSLVNALDQSSPVTAPDTAPPTGAQR